MVGRRFFFVSDLDYNTPAQYSSLDMSALLHGLARAINATSGLEYVTLSPDYL